MSIVYQAAHFHPPTSPEARRELFRSSVSTVLLELTEHCNRRCSYCPVSIVERLKNRTLPSSALDMIIRDLAQIDFDGAICLNLYNEPTADRETLLTAMRKIRAGLNGDYLTKGYIDELFEAGLSRLIVTLHIPPTASWNDEDAINRCIAFAVKLGTLIEIEQFSPGLYIQGHLKHATRRIKVYSHNFEKTGCDRAGSMKNVEVPHERSAPCFRPFETMTIAFDGRMFPCCQFYPDLPENGAFSIGTVESYPSLFDAYCSEAMAGWRRSLFRYGPKASPCNTCLEGDIKGTPEQVAERETLAAAFGI
jgi:hypothetical protein